MGFFATLVASLLLLKGFWFFAGLAIILSGIFDLFDGVVARKFGKVTALGSFLDSVLDRYSDLLLLLALLIHYLKKEDPDLVILTSFVSMGTVLIPYIRAKAEALQVPCNTGLMERAERIILLSIGTLFNGWSPFFGSWPSSLTSQCFIESMMFGKSFVLHWRTKIPNPNFKIPNKFKTPISNAPSPPPSPLPSPTCSPNKFLGRRERLRTGRRPGERGLFELFAT